MYGSSETVLRHFVREQTTFKCARCSFQHEIANQHHSAAKRMLLLLVCLPLLRPSVRSSTTTKQFAACVSIWVAYCYNLDYEASTQRKLIKCGMLCSCCFSGLFLQSRSFLCPGNVFRILNQVVVFHCVKHILVYECPFLKIAYGVLIKGFDLDLELS